MRTVILVGNIEAGYCTSSCVTDGHKRMQMAKAETVESHLWSCDDHDAVTLAAASPEWSDMTGLN